MNRQLSFITITAVLLFFEACSTPDVVIRPDSHFSKLTSITLQTGFDAAVFKPELEKEMMRYGFNVISDSVAQTVAQERKSGQLKGAAASQKDDVSEKAIAKATGDEVTEKTSSQRMKSDYVGKIEYIYTPVNCNVSRTNLTIIELKTGMVVVSVGYEKGGSNRDVAQEIVGELDKALTMATTPLTP